MRECLSGRTLGLSIGPPAQGLYVTRLLEQVAEQRGGCPFVIQADNGSENKNPEVAACLERARVIVLWHEPRTPQHNPRAERGFGDKLAPESTRAADGGRTARWSLARTGCACDCSTRGTLSMRRHRARGSMASYPVELDRIAQRADDRACRDRFYTEACKALRHVALAPQDLALDARPNAKRSGARYRDTNSYEEPEAAASSRPSKGKETREHHSRGSHGSAGRVSPCHRIEVHRKWRPTNQDEGGSRGMRYYSTQ